LLKKTTKETKIMADIKKSSDEGIGIGEVAIVKARAELFMHMYRIAKKHKDQAKQVSSDNINDMNNEIDEAMISLLFSYTCLEAYINTIGEDRLGKNWKQYKDNSTEAKWIGVSTALATTKNGKMYSVFNKGRQPFKSFLELEKIREEIIHREAKFGDIVETKYGKTEGTINTLNCDKAEWACNIVKSMIIKLRDNIQNPPPIDWLD
jgi:hypothetical protein